MTIRDFVKYDHQSGVGYNVLERAIVKDPDFPEEEDYIDQRNYLKFTYGLSEKELRGFEAMYLAYESWLYNLEEEDPEDEEEEGYDPAWDDADDEPLKYMTPEDPWSGTEDYYMEKHFKLCENKIAYLRYLMPHRTKRAIVERALAMDLIKEDEEEEEDSDE